MGEQTERITAVLADLKKEVEQLSKSELANDAQMRGFIGVFYTIRWVLSELLQYMSSANKDAAERLKRIELIGWGLITSTIGAFPVTLWYFLTHWKPL